MKSLKKIVNKIIVLFILFACASISAQNSTIYGLKKEYTLRHIRKNMASPYAYSVSPKTIFLNKETKIKQESTEYLLLQDSILNFEKNIDAANNRYLNKIEKHKALSLAVENIHSFLESKKPINLNRSILKESQKILDAHNINELVYADESFNKKYHVKFMVLSSNYSNLKLNLRKVINNIKAINTKPIERTSNNTEDALQKLKNKLSKTSTHILVKGPNKKRKKTKLTLTKKINDIPSQLTGKFISMGNYSLISKDYNNEYQKGTLIKKSVASKIGLINTEYIKHSFKKLIKNTSTNKMYVVDNDFFIKYAYTFNGKYRYQVKELTSM